MISCQSKTETKNRIPKILESEKVYEELKTKSIPKKGEKEVSKKENPIF